jgi:acyl-CoA thioester hydrolase
MGEIFTHRLRVRYSECDAQGIVFNGHYLFYMDVALTEWWREAFGSYNNVVEQGYDVVLAETTLRYLSGARFDELLDISLEVASLGNTSLNLTATFRTDDRLIAEGEARHVFVDPETMTKKPMSEDIRATLAQYQPST